MGTLKDDEILATFRSDRELWEDFKALCDKNKISAAKALNRFLKSSVEAGEFTGTIITDDDAITISDLEARLFSKLRSEMEGILAEQGKKQKTTTARRGRS